MSFAHTIWRVFGLAVSNAQSQAPPWTLSALFELLIRWRVECRIRGIFSSPYGRFNARDIEGALCAMHEDVLWANGMESGHVHGREEVRKYWLRQWGLIDPHVEPVVFYCGSEGEVFVYVHQVIRNLNGNVVSDLSAEHVFRMENGLIKRFDIRSR